jgi:hypothetical protein
MFMLMPPFRLPEPASMIAEAAVSRVPRDRHSPTGCELHLDV